MSIYRTLYNKSVYSILEAYIGKTPTLLEIESKLEILRSKTRSFYKELSRSKEVQEINRLFEKQFGMDLFSLQIEQSERPNAYTMVLARNFDVAKYMDLPKMVEGSATDGYRFKEGNNLCIVITVTYGLIFDPKYTPGQILAIILHELGHNFADCLYDKINIANKDLMLKYEEMLAQQAILMGLLTICTLGAFLPYYILIKKQQKEYNNSTRLKKYSKDKKASWLRGLIRGIKGKNADKKSIRYEILARKKGATNINNYKRYMSHTKNRNKDSVNRQNEVFADKFAGVYGYGPEIAQGLINITYDKSETVKEMEERNERFRKASEAYDEAIVDITDYDEHPGLVQRINEEIKLLERELNKGELDPELEKVMRVQLQQLKDLLQDITDTSKKLSKFEEIQNVYNDYCNKNTPDAVNDEIEEAIEQSLDKLIDEDKKKHKK